MNNEHKYYKKAYWFEIDTMRQIAITNRECPIAVVPQRPAKKSVAAILDHDVAITIEAVAVASRRIIRVGCDPDGRERAHQALPAIKGSITPRIGSIRAVYLADCAQTSLSPRLRCTLSCKSHSRSLSTRSTLDSLTLLRKENKRIKCTLDLRLDPRRGFGGTGGLSVTGHILVENVI